MKIINHKFKTEAGYNAEIIEKGMEYECYIGVYEGSPMFFADIRTLPNGFVKFNLLDLINIEGFDLGKNKRIRYFGFIKIKDNSGIGLVNAIECCEELARLLKKDEQDRISHNPPYFDWNLPCVTPSVDLNKNGKNANYNFTKRLDNIASEILKIKNDIDEYQWEECKAANELYSESRGEISKLKRKISDDEITIRLLKANLSLRESELRKLGQPK